ncbi:MAG: hypothetical protein VW338_01645 [Rhodospirillaceae bacterium]
MLHRKLIEPALARLEGEQTAYFSRVLSRLDEDPRVDVAPNLVYFLVSEVMPLCPTYVPVRDLVDRMLKYVAVNKARLNKALFDSEYVDGARVQPDLKRMAGEVVNQILAATMDKFQAGEIDTGEPNVYRFSGGEDLDDFPDDED